MEPMKQYITQKFVGMAQYLTPILKESKFRETGVLTPEEFVAAGDHLIHHCPTWYWKKGDDSKVNDFLPPNKQYLVTNKVPCYMRVKEVESYSDELEKVIEIDDTGSFWVDTHHYSKTDQVCDEVAELKIEDKESKDQQVTKAAAGDNDDDDDEAIDMDEFIKSGYGVVEENTECIADTRSNPSGEHGNIIATRVYDLNITYDKYYQTPRLWLQGYDETRQPLTVDQMYEDISVDHARKSVTMEAHPHLVPNIPVVSVHPCRHAEVMKKMIERVAEGGKELGVHLYIMIFLKFMQAVIPTIEYDFTQSFVLENES